MKKAWQFFQLKLFQIPLTFFISYHAFTTSINFLVSNYFFFILFLRWRVKSEITSRFLIFIISCVSESVNLRREWWKTTFLIRFCFKFISPSPLVSSSLSSSFALSFAFSTHSLNLATSYNTKTATASLPPALSLSSSQH